MEMEFNRDTVKKVLGTMASFGGAMATGTLVSCMLSKSKIGKILAIPASAGLGVIVGRAAKEGSGDGIDGIFAIYDTLKERIQIVKDDSDEEDEAE